jgi:hypothetical protein
MEKLQNPFSQKFNLVYFPMDELRPSFSYKLQSFDLTLSYYVRV